MHRYSHETEALAQSVLRIALDRLRMDAPLDGPIDPATLARRAGQAVSSRRGWAASRPCACGRTCWRRPRCRSTTPATWRSSRAPRPRPSTLFDLVVGATSIYGGSWLESAGAVYAENQALRWVADLAGLPAQAGGVFVPGRHRRQPVGPGHGPPHHGRAAGRLAAGPLARRRHGRDPQLGRLRPQERDGRRPAVRPRRRARAA